MTIANKRPQSPRQGRRVQRPRRFHCGSISLGLSRHSREFGVRRYSTAILPAWVMALADIRQAGTFFSDDPGTRIPPYSFVAYDQIDSGLNPNGPYLVSMVGVDLLANWANHDADAKRMRRE